MAEMERIFLFFLALVFLAASSLLIGHFLWRLLWKKGKGEFTHCRLSSFEEEVSSGDFGYYGKRALSLVDIYQEGEKFLCIQTQPSLASQG